MLLLFFFSTDIQIIAPSPQQLVYQSNSTILCSSANDTLVNWFSNNEGHIEADNSSTYAIEDDGLHITSVEFYHQQQYECEHTILIAGTISKRVTIDVTVVGMYVCIRRWLTRVHNLLVITHTTLFSICTLDPITILGIFELCTSVVHPTHELCNL